MASQNVDLVEIKRLDDSLLIPWIEVYENSFPEDEKILVSSILKQIRGKEQGRFENSFQLAAVDQASNLVGIVSYEAFPAVSSAVLWYLAVAPGRQDHGYGSAVYRRLTAQIHPEIKALFIEVEIPELVNHPAEAELARRRIQFYRRNGAFLMGGVEHLQRVGHGQPEKRMHLMAHPLVSLSPQAAFRMAKDSFRDPVSQVGELVWACPGPLSDTEYPPKDNHTFGSNWMMDGERQFEESFSGSAALNTGKCAQRMTQIIKQSPRGSTPGRLSDGWLSFSS